MSAEPEVASEHLMRLQPLLARARDAGWSSASGRLRIVSAVNDTFFGHDSGPFSVSGATVHFIQKYAGLPVLAVRYTDETKANVRLLLSTLRAGCYVHAAWTKDVMTSIFKIKRHTVLYVVMHDPLSKTGDRLAEQAAPL